MAMQTERDFAFIFKDNEGNLHTLYPKTLASQVIAGNRTMKDHVFADNHLSLPEKQAMINANGPSGYVILDENGYVPEGKINSSIYMIKTEFSDIDDMLSNSSSVPYGSLVMVVDASKDENVDNSWAVYRRNSSSERYWILDEGWVRVFEKESIDLDFEYKNLPGKPDTSIEEIDSTVRKSHEHLNLELLNLLTTDNEGNITFNGQKLALEKNVQRVFISNNFDEEDFRSNDLLIDVVYSQSWWNSTTIQYAGDSCYELFKDDVSIIEAPRLRTEDVITVCRMFAGCSNLEYTQQYNTKSCTDFSAQYYGCSKLKNVPYMFEGTTQGTKFDNMFNGCASLEYTPKIDLSNATSTIAMFANCSNITRVNNLGDTSKVTNMKQMFYGCESLIKISSAIDFTSISNSNAVEDMFTDCDLLELVTFVPGTLKVSLSLQGTNLTRTVMDNIISSLPTVDTNDGIKTLDLRDIPESINVNTGLIASASARGWRILVDE